MLRTTDPTIIRSAAALSAAGRYSLIWLGSAVLGLVVGSEPRRFAWFAVAIALEWVFVNAPIKLIFRRNRPDPSEIADLIPLWLRPPRSSSFPSGHSSAASFAATIWWAFSPITGILATVVAVCMGLSRVILRAHHRTDVAAGWALGAIIALVLLALFPDQLPT